MIQSLKLIWLFLILLVGTVTAMGQTSGLAYGPPQVLIDYYGTSYLLPFQETDSNGSDEYLIDQTTFNIVLRIDSSDTLSLYTDFGYGGHLSYPGTYDPATSTFSMGSSYGMNFAAMSGDGNTFLSTTAGIVYSGPDSLPYFWNGVTGTWSAASYCYQKPDSTWLEMWPNVTDGAVLQIGTSPWYLFTQANGVLNVSQSAAGVWTPTNISIGSLRAGTPLQFYFDGQPAPAIGATSGGGETQTYWAEAWYQEPDGLNGIFTLEYGVDAAHGPYSFIIDPFGNTLQIDVTTWTVSNLPPGEDITITPFESEGQPRYGPPFVVDNYSEAILAYTGSDANGSDVYWSSLGGSVMIAPDGTATLSYGNTIYTDGIYNPNTLGGFDSSDGTLIALDAYGNELGASPGVTVYTSGYWDYLMLAVGGQPDPFLLSPIRDRMAHGRVCIMDYRIARCSSPTTKTGTSVPTSTNIEAPTMADMV